MLTEKTPVVLSPAVRPSTSVERRVSDDPRVSAFQGLVNAIDEGDIPNFCQAIQRLRAMKIGVVVTGDGIGGDLINPFKALLDSIDRGDEQRQASTIRSLQRSGIEVSPPASRPALPRG